MQRSEDLQLVHYDSGATFGMHHDSSKFLPRFLTAFYYLNEPDAGGETAFPAAGGAMSPAEAMALREPAAEGAGLVVKPLRGAALLWYNHDPEGARIEEINSLPEYQANLAKMTVLSMDKLPKLNDIEQLMIADDRKNRTS